MKRAIRTESQRLRQIRALTEVSHALTYAVSLDEVFQLTVDRAADLLAAKKSLLLIANEDGLLALRSSHGVDVALGERFHEPLNEALAHRLAELLGEPPESFLGVPLVVAGAVKGILVVTRPAPSSSAEHDEWLLSALADQAAVALEKTRLDEIGEFREQLIGIVGHDLRNPLNTVLMAARLLILREGLGEKETELARKITSSASLAVRLVDQLLDLTGVWDRDGMYQLLANLVGNAIQHGEPRSSVEVRVDGGESEVVIEVANRGEPIPPAALPLIFDAFRLRGDHRPRTHGLGLGLFIAQQIARSHGGSIGVTSSESDGTTFRVRLPRGVAAEP